MGLYLSLSTINHCKIKQIIYFNKTLQNGIKPGHSTLQSGLPWPATCRQARPYSAMDQPCPVTSTATSGRSSRGSSASIVQPARTRSLPSPHTTRGSCDACSRPMKAAGRPLRRAAAVPGARGQAVGSIPNLNAFPDGHHIPTLNSVQNETLVSRPLNRPPTYLPLLCGNCVCFPAALPPVLRSLPIGTRTWWKGLAGSARRWRTARMGTSFASDNRERNGGRGGGRSPREAPGEV